MGFNSVTFFEFILGLILPIVIILVFMFSKKRKTIAYDAISYGFLSFLGSIVAAFLAFVFLNMFFMNSFSFESQEDGMTVAGVIIAVLVLILGTVCELMKTMTVKHFLKQETRNRLSSVAFAAGVVLSQNIVLFIALNLFDKYEMTVGYAFYSGGVVCITGIMYTALSAASEIMLREGYDKPAFAISAVYYLFWLLVILFSSSTVLLYIITAFFFSLSLALSGVFLVRYKK